jgi:hypothetical protein
VQQLERMAQLAVCTMDSAASLLSFSSSNWQRQGGFFQAIQQLIPSPRGRMRNVEAKRRKTQRSASVLVRASNQDPVGVDKSIDLPQGKVFVNNNVWLTMIEAELERGNDVQALSLAQNLRGFGKAALVSVR